MNIVFLPYFIKNNKSYSRGNTDVIDQKNVYIKTILINLKKNILLANNQGLWLIIF